MGWPRILSSGALALLAGCGAPARTPLTSDQCHYQVTLRDAEQAVLDVDVRCSGPEIESFALDAPGAAPFVRAWQGSTQLAREQRSFRLEQRGSQVRLRYQVDLAKMGDEYQDFDIALHQSDSAGSAVVSPASTWLLLPEPLPAGLPIRVSVKLPHGSKFRTGLRRAGQLDPESGAGDYELLAQEIPVATYSAFGDLSVQELEFPPPIGCSGSSARECQRGTLEVVSLPRLKPSAVAHRELLAWVQRSAASVSDFWHGFPVTHASLFLIPVRNRDDVIFGKVLPASAPSIALLVGEDATKDELDDDWILVHELFHLGVPSFSGEGKWFDEGLATYYEPVIRARAGNKSEEDVWNEFAHQMGKGLDAMRSTGLEGTQDYDAVYWGGALVCLLADLEARRHSDGRLGLEDGLREVLRQGGQASEVWPLAQVMRVVDRTLGASVLTRLNARYGARGSAVDLGRLLKDLGVARADSGIAFVEAPDAQLRRWLVYPAARSAGAVSRRSAGSSGLDVAAPAR